MSPYLWTPSFPPTVPAGPWPTHSRQLHSGGHTAVADILLSWYSRYCCASVCVKFVNVRLCLVSSGAVFLSVDFIFLFVFSCYSGTLLHRCCTYWKLPFSFQFKDHSCSIFPLDWISPRGDMTALCGDQISSYIIRATRTLVLEASAHWCLNQHDLDLPALGPLIQTGHYQASAGACWQAHHLIGEHYCKHSMIKTEHLIMIFMCRLLLPDQKGFPSEGHFSVILQMGPADSTWLHIVESLFTGVAGLDFRLPLALTAHHIPLMNFSCGQVYYKNRKTIDIFLRYFFW